jgi:membrane protein DedA with SNARE-associated domain
MVSAFTYGLKIGVTAPWLVLLNTLAVSIEIAAFYVPTYLLSDRLHDSLQRRMGPHYDRGARIVERLGAFQTAVAMGFVMPSSAAMIVVGLLRLNFWRALVGLFIGSATYVVIPLLIALPLASTLPAEVLPLLQWTAPAIAAVVIIVSLVHAGWKSSKRNDADAPEPS